MSQAPALSRSVKPLPSISASRASPKSARRSRSSRRCDWPITHSPAARMRMSRCCRSILSVASDSSGLARGRFLIPPSFQHGFDGAAIAGADARAVEMAAVLHQLAAAPPDAIDLAAGEDPAVEDGIAVPADQRRALCFQADEISRIAL